MFFPLICAAIKIAVLVSWRKTPVPLCLSNDLQLEIQKRCYLKNVGLDFVLLVLKLYPTQVISLPLWIKLTMDQLLLLFLCKFWRYFNYIRSVIVTNLF